MEAKKAMESTPPSAGALATSTTANNQEKPKGATPPVVPIITKATNGISEKAKEADTQKNRTSVDRDIALTQVEQEKKLSFIKAWEESEQNKAINKAQKKLSAIDAWENSKKASLEAKLKAIQEELEKKKAEYAEKMKNKVALIHKQAEEKRAMAQANKGEEVLIIQEKAAKYRATGYVPKKSFGCVSC